MEGDGVYTGVDLSYIWDDEVEWEEKHCPTLEDGLYLLTLCFLCCRLVAGYALQRTTVAVWAPK